MFYETRSEAGRELAKEIIRELVHDGLDGADKLVLALPRGGAPVAAEVAKALEAPLDLVLAQKIVVPHRPDHTIAVVVEGAGPDGEPHVIVDRAAMERDGITQEQLETEKTAALAEIARRRETYLADRARQPIRDRVVILVDDGAATGDTARAALKALRHEHPKSLIVGLPVASLDALDSLTDDSDRVVCLATPDPFHSLARHYGQFSKVSDEEIVALLKG